MVSTFSSIADEILEEGHAIVTGRHALAAMVDEVLDAGRGFFARPVPENGRASTPGCVEGFVPFGAGFCEDPQRPDLCETFVHWGANTRAPAMRQPPMFFCNPSIEAEVEPWVRNEVNAGLDVMAEIIRNSARFGLKPVDAALKVTGPG